MNFNEMLDVIQVVAARNATTYHFQHRKFFHSKQTLINDSVSQMQHFRRYADGIQRVPDVTTVPELSPSGYVLTPAPTPPDAEGPPCFSTLEPITEQRVPIHVYSSAENLAELRPLTDYHPTHSIESVSDPSIHPTPPMDYQVIPHPAESPSGLAPKPL